MATNTARFVCRVEWDGANWLIWQGQVLMLTTNSPRDLVAATRGKIRAPQAKPEKSYRLETTEEFLARGGKIKKVRASALGFEFSEEEISQAIEQSRRAYTPSTPVAAGSVPTPAPCESTESSHAASEA